MTHETCGAITSPMGERALVAFQTPWALEAAAVIDRHAPGFLVRVLRSKPTERHAIFAVLAHPDNEGRLESVDGDPGWLSGLGEWLTSQRPRALIEGAWEACPEGVLGCFERLTEPLEVLDYRRLIQVMSDPAQRQRHRMIQHARTLNGERLRGLLILDDALCCDRMCAKLRTEEQARMANDVLALVRELRPELTCEHVRTFASQAEALSPLDVQLERLLLLVDELPPFETDLPPSFDHLRTRKQFEALGREFRNCLATKFDTEALTGRALFLRYQPRPAIAVLVATNSGWLLGKVHAPCNASASVDLVEEVRAALAGSGLPFITPAPVIGSRAMTRRLLMRHDPFGLGPDEFEGWVPDLD